MPISDPLEDNQLSGPAEANPLPLLYKAKAGVVLSLTTIMGLFPALTGCRTSESERSKQAGPSASMESRSPGSVSGQGSDRGTGQRSKPPSRATVISSIAARPASFGGTGRYSVRTQLGRDAARPPAIGEGTADFKANRYLVRMEEELPGIGKVVYDNAVAGTKKYQKQISPKPSAWIAQDFDPAELPLLVPHIELITGEADWPLIEDKDPARRQIIEAMAEKVRYVGTDTLRGTPTHHFRISLSEGRARSTLPKRLESQLGPVPKHIDAWIDAEGRLRRLSTSEGAQYELWDFDTASVAFPPDLEPLLQS